MKKLTANGAKKRCWNLCREIVLKRDGDACQHCGKHVEGSDRQVSHVIPRSANGRMSVEPLNCKVMCYHCHLNWWHKNPVEAGQWFRETFPARWAMIELLHAATRHRGTIRITEWREIESKLRGML